MPLTQEGNLVSDWLQYDEPRYSRDNVVVRAGSGSARELTTGMVVSKRTRGAATAGAVVGTGNGVMGTITPGAAAKPGVYELRIISEAADAGDFIVKDPDGAVVGYGTVGVAFNQGGLAFTLADGSTDFDIGATIAITVAAGDGKVQQIDFSGTNGDEDAYGVLYGNVTAPDAVDAAGVAVARHAVVETAELVWPSGATAGQKAAALAQLEARGFKLI